MTHTIAVGSLEDLVAEIVRAAKDFDGHGEGAPTFFFVQLNSTSGWAAEFATSNDLVMSMTQWDASDDVAAVYNAALAGNDAAILDYAGNVLSGWEDEWTDVE